MLLLVVDCCLSITWNDSICNWFLARVKSLKIFITVVHTLIQSKLLLKIVDDEIQTVDENEVKRVLEIQNSKVNSFAYDYYRSSLSLD